MEKYSVALVRYEQPRESVRRAVDLSGGLKGLSASAKVFLKPNIVFWTRGLPFPKWGVITTSRVVLDMIELLKDHGVNDITIGEGTVVYDPKDKETAAEAFETLGYQELSKRYGVKVVNVFDRPFEKVDLGDGVALNINADFLESDFLVNVPVLKTHAQTVVSLGIKNVKGLIDINSRKKCHSAEPGRDLHFMVSKLASPIPPSCTLIDGIYTNERGPGFDGKIRRSNLLIASSDTLAADMVGAKVLGYEPADVPHLVYAAKDLGRNIDISTVEVVGRKIEDVAMQLTYSFPYNEDGTLPEPMAKMGLKGVSYPKYDLTICTYCSLLTGVTLYSIARAWKGEPWDDVEILTGKVMKPSPDAKKTILIGKCLYEANKDHPRKDDLIAIKTCPPSPEAVVNALHQAGIDVDPVTFQYLDKAPVLFMGRYDGKPDFDESLFRIE